MPSPFLTVTITVDWQPVTIAVSRRALVSDATLWQHMHIGDWDRLPPPLRIAGLRGLVGRYRYFVEDRCSWREMTPSAWDEIPQPIRGLVFMRMIADWAEHDRLAARAATSRRDTTQVVQAIAMTESWFEHRAAHTNPGGDTDLGLGQLSLYARRTLTRLARGGVAELDVVSDAAYLDPMVSARRLVFWFGLMLEEAGGDVDLAVRAYNQGISRARAGGGERYLRDVTRVWKGYVRTSDRSASWHYLREQLGQPHRVPAGCAKRPP